MTTITLPTEVWWLLAVAVVAASALLGSTIASHLLRVRENAIDRKIELLHDARREHNYLAQMQLPSGRR